MRDKGAIYVAGHPLLNRRSTRLPGHIRLRNDRYCVEWGVKLYSLAHSLTHPRWGRCYNSANLKSCTVELTNRPMVDMWPLCCGKVSTIGQPTRPTQPSIPSGSV